MVLFSTHCKGNTVSIHAPREGCDSRAPIDSPSADSFNSRTPGGVRQLAAEWQRISRAFQFTHPGRGATSDASVIVVLQISFQFTHPGRGATNIYGGIHRILRGFNSRTPGGVRPYSI